MNLPFDLIALREEYFTKGLRRIDLDPDPIKEFGVWYTAAMEVGISEMNAVALATVAENGQPTTRMVLLKGYDHDGFVFYTNYLSEKGRHLEKNPRAAEASFQKVLMKYPDQTRAWYGIGLVALLDHDAARAKQVFGRLTTGEHAATLDPMVLAWSHVYLARIYDDEGNPEVAKMEYQSVLNVEGGPEQAKQVAQKGLAAFAGDKPTARP